MFSRGFFLTLFLIRVIYFCSLKKIPLLILGGKSLCQMSGAFMGNSTCSGDEWAVGAHIPGMAHPEKPGWGSGVRGGSRYGASEHLDDFRVPLGLKR